MHLLNVCKASKSNMHPRHKHHKGTKDSIKQDRKHKSYECNFKKLNKLLL